MLKIAEVLVAVGGCWCGSIVEVLWQLVVVEEAIREGGK